MSRSILHCDMNNCFASIECLLDPSLRGLPVAVCGAQEERHGIVLAKSEEAKKFGVQTAEAIWQAQQKCPQLVIVTPHYGEYARFSRRAQEIYCQYTDLVEPFGMDECWLDVSGSRQLFGSGEAIAHTIRRRIKHELGITVSVGVSFNKVFAKLGSDMKKPDAVTCIPQDSFCEIIWKLPAQTLLGVGNAVKQRLDRYCIRTVGDIAAARPEFLTGALGKCGLTLWQYANGLDCSPVLPVGFVAPIKSVGHGQTPCADLNSAGEVWLMLLMLAQDVAKRLRENSLAARGVSVRVRDSMLAFTQFQGRTSFPTSCASELARTGFRLFEKGYGWENPVRSVTVTAIDLCRDDMPVQLDITGEYAAHERCETLERATDRIRERYGKSALLPASLLLTPAGEYIPPAFVSRPYL